MKVLDRAKDRTERTGSPYGGEASLARQWCIAFAILLTGLIGLSGLFRETVSSAVRTWYSSDSYNYCFLVIPVCLYLVWRRREVFTHLAPRPSLWGVVAAALMAFIWKLGEFSAILAVQQFAFVAMAQALLLAIVGPRAIRALAFPLFYLYFAVPFGSFLIGPLQEATALIVVRLLQFSGVPVFLDGLLIHIPAATFHIAEACAGARFLLTSLALGFLAAQLFYSQTSRRVLFVALSIVVPIFANGLRAYGIVAIAHWGSFEFASKVDHVTFGLVFLGVVMATLLGLGLTFREEASAPTIRAAWISSGSLVAVDKPYGKATLMGLVSLLAIVGIASLGSTRLPRVAIEDFKNLSMPEVATPWTPMDDRAGDWRPSFAGADVVLEQSYANGGQIVDFYLAHYTHQQQGAEIVNQQNDLAGGSTWSLSEGEEIEVVLEGVSRKAASARLVSGQARRIVWYWYWVDSTFTASPIIAKLRQVKARMLGGSEAAAVIAISTTVSEAPAESEAALRDFLNHIEPIGLYIERLTPSSDADGSSSAGVPRLAWVED